MKQLIKRVFHAIPYKSLLFYGFRQIFKPGENIYKHLYFKGKFKTKTIQGKPFYLNHYETTFENVIFWEGMENCWEKHSIKIWEQLALKSSVIFDIGANTGVFSLVACAANPSATIHAFEPLERMYTRLKDNVALNKFPIYSHKTAVANFNGKAILYDLPHEIMRQATLNKKVQLGKDKIAHEVEVITLKSFIETNEIEGVDLIKIDVETFEPEVLEGMGEYLAKFKPAILLEILNSEVGERIELILKNAGYSFFYNIDENKGLFKTTRIKGGNNRNFLCLSKGIEENI